jgi:uncharacterized protein (DUF1330 family)
MSHEILVALNVSNDEVYQSYRNAMAPILNQYGGRFCYDFKVSDVLKAEQNEEVNRVFTLNFPSAENKEGFFNDPAYLLVKNDYFDKSVASVHILAAYDQA